MSQQSRSKYFKNLNLELSNYHIRFKPTSEIFKTFVEGVIGFESQL